MSQIHGVNPNGEVTEVAVENNGRLLISGGSGATAAQSLGANQVATLQTAATATGNGTSISLAGLSGGNLAITGTFVGTVTFEAKDAAGNWQAILLQSLNSTTLATATTSTGVWRMPVGGFSDFRARISAYTSGSITATVFAENTAHTPAVQNIGVYEKLDSVNDSITTYPLGHNVTTITTATTTTIKTGSGAIRQIRVLGGTMGNVTVYDNTAGSGTVLVPTVTPAASHVLLEDAAFSTGLTIVTAAATILVITWR